MTYVKRTWIDGAPGNTPIDAADLNRMEDGIFNADAAATQDASDLAAHKTSHDHDALYDLAGTAIAAVNSHTVAGDPHGDRAYTDSRITSILNAPPSTLDTLKELADALGDDPNFATTMATALGIRNIGVNHGSVASTARPTSTLPVFWFGTVAPTNAVANDMWMDRSTDLWKRYTGSAWNNVGAPATTTLPDTAISVNPSGLAVIQGSDTNVHAALARLDANFANKGNPKGNWAATTVYNVNDIVIPPTASGRTGAWRCITAHTSGTTFDSSKFEQWGSTKLADLSDTSLTGSVGQVLTLQGSGIMALQSSSTPQISGGWKINNSGIQDSQSIIAATGPSTGGNAVTVTDGAGNPLTITVPANPGRPVYLDAIIPIIRDANTSTTLFVRVDIQETTLSSVLTANSLTAINFTSPLLAIPPIANALVKGELLMCEIDSSELPVARSWVFGYTLYNVGGNVANRGHYIQNINGAATTVATSSGTTSYTTLGNRGMSSRFRAVLA